MSAWIVWMLAISCQIIIAHDSAPATAPASAPAPAPVKLREIDVHVTIDSFDDRPLPRFAVCVRASKENLATDVFGVAWMDDAGHAVVQASVPEDVTTVFVSEFVNPVDRRYFESGDATKSRKALEQIRMTYYVPELADYGSRPCIHLQDEKREYAVTLKAGPAIKIVGAVVEADGTPRQRVRAIARHASMPVYSGRDGVFTVFGAPKGQENELFVVNVPRVHSYTIGAKAATTDVSVPKVQASEQETTVPCHITLTGLDRLRDAQFARDGGGVVVAGVTLISRDATMVLTSLLEKGTLAESSGTLDVPPGSYYVVPGLFSANSVQLKTLDVLRAGRMSADAGVPLIEVALDASPTISVDAVAASAAIDGLPPE